MPPEQATQEALRLLEQCLAVAIDPPRHTLVTYAIWMIPSRVK